MGETRLMEQRVKFLNGKARLPDQTPKEPPPELAMQRHGQHDRNPCFDQAYVAAPLAIPDQPARSNARIAASPEQNEELRHEVATSTSATST